MPKMLGKVLRSLFSQPATLKYPAEKPEVVKGTRGRVWFDLWRCDYCQDCERICPPAAITVYPEARKIVYDPFRCIYCHQCVQNCMQGAIKPDETPRKAEYDKVVDVFEYGKAD
jgi:ech hydrogenase subunit F